MSKSLCNCTSFHIIHNLASWLKGTSVDLPFKGAGLSIMRLSVGSTFLGQLNKKKVAVGTKSVKLGYMLYCFISNNSIICN